MSVRHTYRAALGGQNSPATRPFREKSLVVRLAKNTSASSMSRMHPHLLARAKFVSREDSTSLAVVPRSPSDRGRCFSSLTLHMSRQNNKKTQYEPHVI